MRSPTRLEAIDDARATTTVDNVRSRAVTWLSAEASTPRWQSTGSGVPAVPAVSAIALRLFEQSICETVELDKAQKLGSLGSRHLVTSVRYLPYSVILSLQYTVLFIYY